MFYDRGECIQCWYIKSFLYKVSNRIKKHETKIFGNVVLKIYNNKNVKIIGNLFD